MSAASVSHLKLGYKDAHCADLQPWPMLPVALIGTDWPTGRLAGRVGGCYHTTDAFTKKGHILFFTVAYSTIL